MPPPLRNTIILSGFILLKFILQFNLIDPVYELHRDEFLYLDQGNHLAAGYASVPPLTSWISFIIKMLGNTIFWVKFFLALFGALTMLVVWKVRIFQKGEIAIFEAQNGCFDGFGPIKDLSYHPY